jgi:trimeric autotransporter adhesin
VYGGIVRNTGNITLTNITVVSSQPVPNTIVFNLASLAPGASANFSSSFNAPLNACSVASTLIVTGQDRCTGNTVTVNETSVCPLVALPGIAVTKICPFQPGTSGGVFVFTGTVTNTGNVTLTNVFVFNNQPAPNTLVFGPVTLGPGAAANFTDSYTIPANLCAITDTLTARGNDSCSGTTVSISTTTTCPITTSARLSVTQRCPPNPVEPGVLLTYSGSVFNSGNTTLTNIVVTSDRTGAVPVFALATLAVTWCRRTVGVRSVRR